MSALAVLAGAYEAARRTPVTDPERAVGVIGLDVPVELIAAAGLTAVPVRAEVRSAGAEAFAEGLGSPALRSLVAALIDGPYASLRRLIVSTTPGAYASLYAFLREARRAGEAAADLDIRLFDFNRGPSPSMVEQRRRALADLKATIEAWTGQAIGDGDVAAAITSANGVRARQRTFQAARESDGARVSGPEALMALEAGVALNPAAYAATLGEAAAELAARPTLTGRRTVYSGAETHTPGLYRDLEAAGLVIVADDQDAGTRAIGPDVADRGDPLAALAQRYLCRDPAPARFTIAERTDYLMALVRRAGAEHVVFGLSPFEHPAAWDHPSQRAALQAAGVTSEVVEAGHV